MNHIHGRLLVESTKAVLACERFDHNFPLLEQSTSYTDAKRWALVCADWHRHATVASALADDQVQAKLHAKAATLLLELGSS